MIKASAVLRPLTLVLLMVIGGCGGDPPASETPETIPESTFVMALAELHHAKGTALEGELTPAVRDEILARHGIEEEDLVTFAQVMGGDIPTMLRIWEEVARQSRLLDAPDAESESGTLP